MAGLWNRGVSGQGGVRLNSQLFDVAALSNWIRSRRHRLPKTRLGRTALGITCVLGGLFSFLPILGVWMLPLGLVILSIDWAVVRRYRRQGEVKLSRWWKGRQAARA
jgi:purine-cytosine permease-like protein